MSKTIAKKTTTKTKIAAKKVKSGMTSAKAVSSRTATKRKSPNVIQKKVIPNDNQYTVFRSVDLNATPSEVWDALTNPEKTKKYFFNCEVFSDWKPGSPITFKGTILLLKKIEMHGTIEKIEREKLLMYTLDNDHGDGTHSTSTVTDKLSYADGKTTLTITDNVGSGDGADDRYKKSEKGWDKVLAGLKKVVEK